MGLMVQEQEQKRRKLLQSMAALARRSTGMDFTSGGGDSSTTSTSNMGSDDREDAVVTGSGLSARDSALESRVPSPPPSPSPLSLPSSSSSSPPESAACWGRGELELRKEVAGPCILPSTHQPRIAPLRLATVWANASQSPAPSVSLMPTAEPSVIDGSLPPRDAAHEVDECSRPSSTRRRSIRSSLAACATATATAGPTPGDITSDESIMFAVALLRKLQQRASENERGEASVRREEVDQILRGFSRALEAVTTTWDERSVEDTMQKLFVTHSNVFDESMQNFFIQNFLHESECAKTFRTALRRTSMLRRCLLAMYQPDHSSDGARPSGDKALGARRWSEAVSRIMKQKEEERRRHSIDVCPEVTNPAVVFTVKSELANISSWDFDVLVVGAAVPGQALCIVGNALLEKYDFCSHFRSSKTRVLNFLRQIERRYHAHPYHNAEHAADVTQTLHHFMSVGELGSLFSERTKCAALLAAIVHDVGHTSYSNNFHITVNDELAVQYVYRSPLEHMHCALAFQLLKDPQCNILQGLTKIEQLEVRNLITDMVLATDNSVHSAYLAKLDTLVRRTAEESWDDTNADDEKLVLQMALHAADVSNPSKSLRIYLVWAERIKKEFYQQGDKERELQLPVSVGYDRENPIPLEKMQAGFIIGIVRPLFSTMSQLPSARLAHCMKQLDANLNHWQDEINRNQASPQKPSTPASDSAVSSSDTHTS